MFDRFSRFLKSLRQQPRLPPEPHPTLVRACRSIGMEISVGGDQTAVVNEMRDGRPVSVLRVAEAGDSRDINLRVAKALVIHAMPGPGERQGLGGQPVRRVAPQVLALAAEDLLDRLEISRPRSTARDEVHPSIAEAARLRAGAVADTIARDAIAKPLDTLAEHFRDDANILASDERRHAQQALDLLRTPPGTAPVARLSYWQDLDRLARDLTAWCNVEEKRRFDERRNRVRTTERYDEVACGSAAAEPLPLDVLRRAARDLQRVADRQSRLAERDREDQPVERAPLFGRADFAMAM